MTIDFMDAFTVNSIEEAAIYSLNAHESAGINRRRCHWFGKPGYSDPRYQQRHPFARVFRSGISTDNYNLTRVSISSGPNAILFGTGSAGGSIDSTIARAELHRQKGSAGLQVDSNGSLRAEFDLQHSPH